MERKRERKVGEEEGDEQREVARIERRQIFLKVYSTVLQHLSYPIKTSSRI